MLTTLRNGAVLGGIALTIYSLTLSAFEPIQTLKKASVPESSDLAKYVKDKALAVALGKALFWDMQVGSDGIQSCASCHFQAGADNRSFNQVSPTPASLQDRVFSIVAGSNAQLQTSSFPVHANDTVSSQGVCLAQFAGIAPGNNVDFSTPLADPVFKSGGRNVRRVEPRNTPTAIGAVFNHRNFWDGRAKNIFNGVTPFGDEDPSARVVVLDGGSLQAIRVSIENSSLASQAVGPPVNDFEMSFSGRTFPDVGRKMLALAPLAKQRVSPTDSLLGPHAKAGGNGAWTGQTYASLIRSAFEPKWWNGTQIVAVNPDRSLTFRSSRTGAANEYTQMEYNFSLFFGLAVQMYEATLIPDDTRFDRYDSREGELTSFELAGKEVFQGKGKCQNCHGGAEFTNASVKNTKDELIERMLMGNQQPAVYDNGFYNIGVRPTHEDLGVGGMDPFGNPLSFSRLFQLGPKFPDVKGDPKELDGSLTPSERLAVDGAQKTAGLRNVALTAPYFRNGGKLTLRQVIDFYNEGGDFRHINMDNLDPGIERLGLTDFEKEALLAFLNTLTDERVRTHKAPFDHPSLDVPLGGAGCAGAPATSGLEKMLSIAAVGSAGYASLPPELSNFLGVNQNDADPNRYNTSRVVDLAAEFNVNAIVSDGTAPANGGLDGSGNAYSRNLLGSAVSWKGLNFNFGGGNGLNGITSKTVAMPSGLYSSLKVLGTAFGQSQDVKIVINYTDGSKKDVTYRLSHWGALNPQLKQAATFPGQSQVKTMSYVVGPGGAKVNNGNPTSYGWVLYGYDITLDGAKGVASITLPNNRNVVILGMGLVAAPVKSLKRP